MMAAAVTVAAMTLGELLGPGAAGAHADLAVSDLISDSRSVTPGSAFVAVPGASDHGLRFADDALARGARIVLYEPGEPGFSVPAPGLAVPGLSTRLGELGRRFYSTAEAVDEVIGVTGTNGKTTVAFLVAQALGRLGHDCGYIGTLGFGPPDAIEPHALTTPDCLTLHREIRQIGLSRVVLEVSSHALEQDRTAGVDIGTAAFTNLSRDHLDAHGTLERYAQIKGRLFRRPELERAVLNLDDAQALPLKAGIAADVRVIGVSLTGAAGAQLTATVANRALAGLGLELAGEFGSARLDSSLIGEFNAENLLVATAILAGLNCDLSESAAALSACRPPPGRMEVFGGPPEQPWVVVDYAHTPAALARVLEVLAQLAPGDLTCVFGCGGDRDRGKRPLMGAAAAQHAARIVLTDDNPRDEPPAQIIADIERGIGTHPDVRVEHSRERAITTAVAHARAGDVVLVAGKGHETVQKIGDRQIPFDDRALVARALGGQL